MVPFFAAFPSALMPPFFPAALVGPKDTRKSIRDPQNAKRVSPDIQSNYTWVTASGYSTCGQVHLQLNKTDKNIGWVCRDESLAFTFALALVLSLSILSLSLVFSFSCRQATTSGSLTFASTGDCDDLFDVVQLCSTDISMSSTFAIFALATLTRKELSLVTTVDAPRSRPSLALLT